MKRIMAAWLFLTAAVSAFENRESKADAAGLQVDGYLGFPDPTAPFSADQPFSRAYGYTFLPIAKIAGREFVGYVEASLMVREFRENGAAVNSEFLQSYGAGLGYEIVKTKRHTGFAFGLFGINSDMRHVGSEDLYGDVSYLHQFTLSERLAFGGGLDMHFYVDTYIPYPLLYLDWQIARHTKLKIYYDTGELKQFLSAHWSVSLGAQYDLFHYGLGRGGTYVVDGVSGMARIEYAASEHVFLRLSAKMPVPGGGGETIETTSAGKQEIADEGVSVRLQVAYGI